MVDFCKVRIFSRNRQHFTVFYRVASKISPKHFTRFLFREIRGEREKRIFGRCTQRPRFLLTQISIPIAVVLRCPFKISSTAVAVYLHRPMQYICSEKPMRCPDKVTALHPLTHRIVFANAPHCVFSFTAHLPVFLSC